MEAAGLQDMQNSIDAAAATNAVAADSAAINAAASAAANVATP